MNSRRNFLRSASGAVGGFLFATATSASASARPRTVTILNGGRPPARHRGSVGDFYIDTRSHTIYGPKRTTGWGRPTRLIGPAGPAGANGAPGPRGYSVLNGSGPPSAATGVDGDFYIETSTTQLYGPKAGGVWGSPISLTASASPAANNDGLVGATLADLTTVTGANTTQAQTSGALYLTACRVDAAATRLAFEVDSSGSGLISGENLIGIYDANGALVMSTGDLTAAWGSSPNYSVIVVNLPQPLPAGFYYVGVLMNYSGTPIYLTGAACPMLTEIGTRFSAVPRASFSTGRYTTLPASVSFTAGGFAAHPWNFVTFIGFLP